MKLKNPLIPLMLVLALVFSACGPSAEEVAATYVAETAAAASPTPTETPIPTDTPTPLPPTETPAPQLKLILSAASLRAGPGSSYEQSGSVSKDDEFTLIGQAFDCTWYYVQLADGTTGWLSGVTVTTLTPCDQIEEAEIPPTPVVEATATRTPVAASGGSGGSSGAPAGGSTTSSECNGYNPCPGHHSVKVNNKTGANVTLSFVGPANYNITLGPGNGQRIYILPGRYTIYISMCGTTYYVDHQINSNWYLDLKC
ncbi:MAG: SH3 domain-containing protein [Chloroflexi bacterium]|nr:SH3 domain-containing protein [Chloroflexota bacterium]